MLGFFFLKKTKSVGCCQSLVEELHPVAFRKGTAGDSVLLLLSAASLNFQYFSLNEQHRLEKASQGTAYSCYFFPLSPLKKHNRHKPNNCLLLFALRGSALGSNTNVSLTKKLP